MTSNLHHPAHIPAQQPFTWPCSIRIHQVSPIHNIRHDQQTFLNIPAKSFTSPLHIDACETSPRADSGFPMWSRENLLCSSECACVWRMRLVFVLHADIATIPGVAKRACSRPRWHTSLTVRYMTNFCSKVNTVKDLVIHSTSILVHRPAYPSSSSKVQRHNLLKP